MVLVASLYELSRPSSPSGLLHGRNIQLSIIYNKYLLELLSLITYPG